MANVIKPKRTTVAGKVPTTTDLQAGEIALNMADGLMFYRDTSNNIKQVGATLSTVGTAGTYTKVTTDAYGRVTTGTTLSAGDVPTLNQNTTGYAATLQTGRTIGMTGDVTWTSASFNGSANVTGTATLANSGVTAATYGSSTNIPQIAIDAKGRITSASNVAVSIPSGSISVTGGDLTMSGSTGTAITNATLANSGVTAGTYNNSATANQPLTIDAKGRVTATGTAVTITPAFSSITSKPTTLSGYGITDGASFAAGGAIMEYAQTISANYTITSGKNALSVGDITIATGVTVTIPSGSRWVID